MMAKDDGRPSVSVVISAYDRPAFLKDAIQSALDQTISPHQVIVVDDCSPADLAPVAAEFGAAVLYERLSVNGGANRARNRGVELATGDIVAFLDDDDVWLPEKLARQTAAMEGGAEASLCGFDFFDRPTIRVQEIAAVTEDVLRQGNRICGTSGLVARRSALLEEPFDEALPNAQDWDIFVRLARRRPIPYVAAPLFRRRVGSHASITMAQESESLGEMERRTAAIEKHRLWLGRKQYQRRLASHYLRYFSSRKGKAQFLLHALRRAGVVATGHVLCRKLFGVHDRLNP